MAVSEACEVWIQQRIEEELEEKEETGKSLRAIGRTIAKEVLKIFEAEMKPGTILKRASRMAVTNVTPEASTGNNTENSGIQVESSHGGRREGAGRKKRKISQKTAWQNVEKKMSKLVEYMMENCGTPAKIPDNTRSNIGRHIDTINLFYDDF